MNWPPTRRLRWPWTRDVAEAVVHEYARRLAGDPRSGTIVVPVRRAPRLKPVYYLVFVTRHPDGIYLMIDHLSLASRDWREAVSEETLFTNGGSSSLAEQGLAQGWVSGIKENVARLVADKGAIAISHHIPEVFGTTLGEARWMHVRAALKELSKEQVIGAVPPGDVWKMRIARATPP